MAHAAFAYSPDPQSVLSKATLSAADRLNLRQAEIARVLGVSPAVMSRAQTTGLLPVSGKTPEMQKLFVRLYRSLDSITGGEDDVSAAWLRNPNTDLQAVPLEKMQNILGLVDVLRYLDTKRARV